MPPVPLEELLLQNPDAPTNDEYAVHLARQLFPPLEERDTAAHLVLGLADGQQEIEAVDDDRVEWCGEYTYGLLDAVLASDLLSGAARNEIQTLMADAAPALERTKTVGHFRFHWTETSSDSRDNTDEAAIDATAAVLNDCWDRYVTDFRRPQADLVGGVRLLEIDVHFDPSVHGSTSSQKNRILLNSHTVVNDACRRRTTSAHELFHRVEYAYGYVTGTPGQRWWVEALGSWSQEYYAPDIDDYISRVNGGLDQPSTGLLTRSYDACHYWKYLGEQLARRSPAVATERRAIREVLETYATNGLDAKAASGTVTQNRIARPFDRFFEDWAKANYLKDLTTPSATYDYLEDETVTTACGRNSGPYRHVAPDTDETITGNSFSWNSGTLLVDPYGTRYHHFDIAPSVTALDLLFTGNAGGGAGSYSVHLVLIKEGRWQVIHNSHDVTSKRWQQSPTAGQYDRCVVVVNGLSTAGSYRVAVNASVDGSWRDSFGYVWTLTQTGASISGTVATPRCGTYRVSGTAADGGAVVLDATGSCCDFSCRGALDGSSGASGEWTNERGGEGIWSMTKLAPGDASAAPFEHESEEHVDDPATMGS
jgi:hypothetical protein